MTDSPVTKTAEQIVTDALYKDEPELHRDSAVQYMKALRRGRTAIKSLSEAGLLASDAPSENDREMLARDVIDRMFGWKHLRKYGTMSKEWMDKLRDGLARAIVHSTPITPTAPVDRERDLQQSIDDLHEELKIARESRDAALKVMNQHKCGEQAERAYARAVQAESTLAGVGSPVPVQVDEWEYRVEYEAPGSLLLVTSEMETYERAEGFALENIHGGTVMRRRKADPWQPVTEAERGGAQ